MARFARLLVAGALTLAAVGPATTAHAQAPLAPLFTVPGVVNAGALGTFFACTNDDTVAQSVGIDIFGQGGSQLVVATSNAVSLSPQATILFGTQTALGLTIDGPAFNPGIITKGSARILSTTKKIACTAFVADTNGTPPVSMTNLTIAYKGKQKGD
jgi:hypothetical protein